MKFIEIFEFQNLLYIQLLMHIFGNVLAWTVVKMWSFGDDNNNSNNNINTKTLGSSLVDIVHGSYT